MASRLLLQMFRRKKWKYLILDEAHMIKNWKSQRWQTLLRFNSKRRLLITGTPLQVLHGGCLLFHTNTHDFSLGQSVQGPECPSIV